MSGQGNDITISELGDYPFSSSSTARISRTIAAHRGRGELFGAAFHFIVEPLERIGAVQFAAAAKSRLLRPPCLDVGEFVLKALLCQFEIVTGLHVEIKFWRSAR
jgi:hypothetical protein